MAIARYAGRVPQALGALRLLTRASRPPAGAGAVLSGLDRAAVLIGNDYEMALIAQKTGHSVDGLLDLAEIVVTTLGDEGSRIATADGRD